MSVENILFQTYGQVVKRLFVTDHKPDTPLAIFPAATPHEVVEPPGVGAGHLVQHIPAHEWQLTRETILYLQKVLTQERKQHKQQPDKVGQPESGASFHLQEFNQALARNNETRLVNNPFYELTKLAFRHNLSGARHLLHQKLAPMVAQAPVAVPFFAPLRELLFGRQTSFAARLVAIVGKGVLGSKLSLVWTLTLLSALTTAIAVYDLLQPGSGGTVVTDGCCQSETGALLIGLLVGLLLVVPVLNFKSCLYRGMAETGGILRGIRLPFARHPQRMALAALLTLLSIVGNYEGLKVILFKPTALTQQAAAQAVIARVVLGTEAVPGQEDSIATRAAQLEAWVAWVTPVIQRLSPIPPHGQEPLDRDHHAPHHWAIHFIIHGGYMPGVNDIAHHVGGRVANELDPLLEQSGFDWTRPMDKKFQSVLHEYQAHLAHTTVFVQEQLAQLEALFTHQQGIHLTELFLAITLAQRIQQGNQILQAVATALETNEAQYEQTVAVLNTILTDCHALLAKVDPEFVTAPLVGMANVAGSASGRPVLHTITALGPVPLRSQLAVARLTSPTTPTLTQMQDELIRSFGARRGFLLLGFILLLAAGLAIGELWLFAALTTWRGREDRRQIGDRLQALHSWEAAFAEQGMAFFDRADLRQVLPGLAFPNEMEVRNALHRVIEATSPLAKAWIDQTPAEKKQAWYTDLFLPVRMADMVAYNARIDAIGRFRAADGLLWSQWVGYFFPGLRLDRGLGRSTFAELQQQLATAIANEREAFQMEWQNAVQREQEGSAIHSATGTTVVSTPLAGVDTAEDTNLRQINKMLHGMPHGTRQSTVVGDKSHQIPHRQQRQAMTQKQWLASCQNDEYLLAYSRRAWLQEMAVDDHSFGQGLTALRDFVPVLKETISQTMPEVQQEILDPLLDIFDRLPVRCVHANFVNIHALQQQLRQLEKLTMDMSGVSLLLDPTVDAKMRKTRTSQAEIDRIARLIHGGQEKQSRYSAQIDSLTNALRATLQQARAVESALNDELRHHQELIRQAGEKLQHVLTQINQCGWEVRKRSPPSQKHLQLLIENRTVFEQAPRELQVLLTQMEELLLKPPSEDTLQRAAELTLGAQGVVDTAQKILDYMETPTHVDRRLDATGQRKSPTLLKKSPTRQKSTGESRRQAEREPFVTAVEFISAQGQCHIGNSVDLSSTGIRLQPSVAPTLLVPGEQGTLRLLDDPDHTLFPCLVVNFSSTFIALQLLEGIPAFEALLTRQVMARIKRAKH